MKILFLMISFPDSKDNPNLYTELATYAMEQGNEVYVATLTEPDQEKQTGYKNEHGLHVLRIYSGEMFNVNLFRKGLTTLRIPYLFKKEINRFFKHISFDMIIYPTPPITFAAVVQYFKKRDGSTSYLILRDIFPQNALDLGIIKSKLLFQYFRRKEQKLYHLSDVIGGMSAKNISYIKKHNQLQDIKLELLPNWKKVGPLHLDSQHSFRERWQLQDKFIAIFGGNIGIPQELSFLIQLAEAYRNEEDVIFLIVGDGNQKKHIARLISQKKLTNVLLKAPISSKEYDLLLRECDLGLINLNRQFTIPNIPSKTLAYFEAGLPILAAIDKHTDYGQLLETSQAGFYCFMGDLEDYQQKFELLRQSTALRTEMGLQGRRYIEKELTVEKAYQTIMKHLYSNTNDHHMTKEGEEHDQKII